MFKKEKRRLLVIEDDSELSAIIEKHFKTLGYHVEVQYDALGPLARLRKNLEDGVPWDVVLTDLMMPGMDGIEFIHQMKLLAPSLPIVLMTAHGGLETAVKAVKEGAYDFVTKPLNFPKLSISLDRATSFYALRQENVDLRKAMQTGVSPRVVAKSPSMRAICDLVTRVAKSTATVLITGESGTGKEVIAKSIHEQSTRADKPFIAINCAAIPETLLESELFGFAKGAFTGAMDKKIGLFEEADGGTLFLDEIGDLSLPLQAKLLRVLQERTIKRLGENQTRPVDVRMLAATHKNLGLEVQEKHFREDLFFRLNVIPVRIPPLRERREDILPLAEHFLKRFVIANHSLVTGFSKSALEQLTRMNWRGNVRELENTIERAVVLCQTPLIEPADLSVLASFDLQPELPVTAAPLSERVPSQFPVAESRLPMDVTTALVQHFVNSSEAELPTLNALELCYINFVVQKVGGVREKARRILDIDRKTLYKKLREFESDDQVVEPTVDSSKASDTTLLS